MLLQFVICIEALSWFHAKIKHSGSYSIIRSSCVLICNDIRTLP